MLDFDSIAKADTEKGNVLIDDRGTARLYGFDFVRVYVGEGSSGFDWHRGEEGYIAPELIIKDGDVQPTRASDVYALACLGLKVCSTTETIK
jgi:serine/threonine protein kinase